MKKSLLLFLTLLSFTFASAQKDDTVQVSFDMDSLRAYFDQIESTLKYQHGVVQLSNGIGTISVPKGFKYLDGKQSSFVLHDIWGNPLDTTTLGMLVPEHLKLTGDDGWAFIVTYEEIGYVEDDDADDMDYEELLGEMQSDTEAGNPSRTAEGYAPITLVGWASTPFYDQEKKVLHWAKELKFGDAEENTLNYNVRILGRKGVLVLNAVGTMSQLDDVKTNIPSVMSSFTFSEGNKYDEFDPEIDEVAAWTVGGLVAGKVLAKTGLIALLLKNIKLIGLALMGVFTAAWKWFRRKTEPPVVKTFGGNENENSTPVS